MVIVAGGFAVALDPYGLPSGQQLAAGPAVAIALPAAANDQDLDGFHDAVDLWDGNAMVRLEIWPTGDVDDSYWLAGTQDDQWRFGAGRELEWRHVVDPDPLGLDPGSPVWTEHALRTGTWHTSDKFDDSWVVLLDVREDQAAVTIALEHWVERFGADDLASEFIVQLNGNNALVGDAAVPVGERFQIAGDGGGLDARIAWAMDVPRADAQEIAARWAPILHFDSAETFYPSDPALMERFHGFAHRQDDLRTWNRGFSNGRDGYRLLVADFDGDRRTDHQDVQLLWDILREGGDSNRIHAKVSHADGDRIAVQYWLIYPYNYAVGDDGRDVQALAHAGDREFIQLLFADAEAARSGTPESIAYSQHYGGVRIDEPDITEAPFQDGRPAIYVARGTHASYPAPGDDSRLRNAFAGFGDRFDGDGGTWTQDDYRLELLDAQPWHIGYKWGPATRFHRELGSSGQPLLVHSFVYPWHEPVRWANGLSAIDPQDFEGTYGARQ